MENFIQIEGVRLELTQEQVEQLRGIAHTGARKLADLKPGEVFKVSGHDMVVLEHVGAATAVIHKALLCGKTIFGSSNNYDGSKVDELCNRFADELEKFVGPGNLVEFEVDLTSHDGLKDYGIITRKAALLTADRYRQYVEILDRHNPDCWWWLATPDSTPRHDGDRIVLCVARSGGLSCSSFGVDNCGARPFCILKSDIFVSV